MKKNFIFSIAALLYLPLLLSSCTANQSSSKTHSASTSSMAFPSNHSTSEPFNEESSAVLAPSAATPPQTAQSNAAQIPVDAVQKTTEILAAIPPEYQYIINLYFAGGLMLPEELSSNRDAAQGISQDGSTYYPVQNTDIRTLSDLKARTESVFSKRFAEKVFYNMIPYTIREIDGRLYTQEADYGGFFGFPITNQEIHVEQYSESAIVFTCNADDPNQLIEMQNLPNKESIAQTRMRIHLVYENQVWRVDQASIFLITTSDAQIEVPVVYANK